MASATLAASAWTLTMATNPTIAVAIVRSLTTPEVSGALTSNWQTVADVIWPLLLLFILIGVGLVVLAGLALTPGPAIERVSRPLIASLFGALVGAVLALSAVALGFGGYLKPRAYIFLGDQVEAVDGDTFRVGDVSLRLRGIDALELSQVCVGARADCGQAASERIIALMNDAIVVCARRDEASMPPEESFGRPLVDCNVLASDGAFDLGQRMQIEGLAVPYLSASQHVPDNFAFSLGCSPLPRDWRRMSAAERERFEEDRLCELSSDNPR